MSAVRVAVTGANGFIGRALCARLRQHEFDVVAIVRRSALLSADSQVKTFLVSDLTERSALRSALRGVDVVYHAAGRAHVLHESDPDPDRAFERANVSATEAVAQVAIDCGVRRVVLLSSIGVHGRGPTEVPLTERSPIAPVDAYARSKWQAELALQQACAGGRLESVIVRPPLVHGPGVKGNFLRLLRLARSGLPLPLGAFMARRSYIGLDNLCDLLILAGTTPAAAGEVFVPADDRDLTIGELLGILRAALGQTAQILRVPTLLVRGLAHVCGKAEELHKLTDALQVDSSRARTVLAWSPRTPITVGLAEMARWYVRACSAEGTCGCS